MSMPETKHPEVLASEEAYHGRIIDVSVYTVREGEKTYKREVVHHPGGTGVLAVFDDSTMILVRQYRHPTLRYLLELPGGRVEPPELPEVCAARELEEEVGLRAARLEKLTEIFTTPGFCEEKIWIYLATGLIETEHKHDEDEVIEVVRVGFPRAFEMISDGEIEDAKTIIGIMMAATRLGIQP